MLCAWSVQLWNVPIPHAQEKRVLLISRWIHKVSASVTFCVRRSLAGCSKLSESITETAGVIKGSTRNWILFLFLGSIVTRHKKWMETFQPKHWDYAKTPDAPGNKATKWEMPHTTPKSKGLKADFLVKKTNKTMDNWNQFEFGFSHEICHFIHGTEDEWTRIFFAVWVFWGVCLYISWLVGLGFFSSWIPAEMIGIFLKKIVFFSWVHISVVLALVTNCSGKERSSKTLFSLDNWK